MADAHDNQALILVDIQNDYRYVFLAGHARCRDLPLGDTSAR